MNLLLDECIDRRFASELRGHTVQTVQECGWGGLTNGRLLELAQEELDVFLAVDHNLSSQQEVPVLDVAVMVLYAITNRLAD